ncbi:hypothetical protein ACWV26_06195 [Rummeliibacillus sp. JY-2-4R]
MVSIARKTALDRQKIYINSCNPTISERSVRYENNYLTISHNRDRVEILFHKDKLGNVIARYKLRLTSNSIIIDETNEELDFGSRKGKITPNQYQQITGQAYAA